MTDNNANATIDKIVTALRTALTEALNTDSLDDTAKAALTESLNEAITAVDTLQEFVTDRATSIASYLYDLESLDTSDVRHYLNAALETLSDKAE